MSKTSPVQNPPTAHAAATLAAAIKTAPAWIWEINTSGAIIGRSGDWKIALGFGEFGNPFRAHLLHNGRIVEWSSSRTTAAGTVRHLLKHDGAPAAI